MLDGYSERAGGRSYDQFADVDVVRLRDRVAAAKTGHAEDLRERARNDEIRMRRDERDRRFVVGRIRVVEIGLVDEDDRVAR